MSSHFYSMILHILWGRKDSQTTHSMKNMANSVYILSFMHTRVGIKLRSNTTTENTHTLMHTIGSSPKHTHMHTHTNFSDYSEIELTSQITQKLNFKPANVFRSRGQRIFSNDLKMRKNVFFLLRNSLRDLKLSKDRASV